MILQIFAGLMVFLIGTAANAATYKIRHILVDQPGVIVEAANPNEVLKPGKVYVATFPTGKKCSITLKQQIGDVIILNTSACKYVQEITKETLIEDSLADRAKTPAPTPTPTPAPIVDKDKPTAEPAPEPTPSPTQTVTKTRPVFRRVGLSIHYSFTDEMQFREGTTATGGDKLETTLKTDGALGLGLSFVQMAPHNWGFMGNFFYETQRNINLTTSNGATPKISFLVGEGCLVYRWDSFYMPFGLNYSLPITSSFDGSSISNGKSLGIIVGTGLLINDRSSVEFFLRALAMRLTEVSGTTTTSYENGSLPGLGIGYKYWF